MLPLNNIKVIELAGLAPVPLCGMILSDYGANVIRVDNSRNLVNDEILNRGKKSICLNLKQDKELNIFRRLVQSADILLDPYRPGVLEKLCLVPSELQRENPRLIIARLSGYGQVLTDDTPEIKKLKNSPGHDINYLGMSGVLSHLGTDERPQAPVNLIGDFGAGAMSCVNAISFALLSRSTSGCGQVIDCSISLSSAYLCSFLWRSRDKASFLWPEPKRRCANVLDGGAPFYRCYKTKDDKFLAIGALEPKFYSVLLRLLSVPEKEAPQYSVSLWPTISARFEKIFASQTQQQWIDVINVNEDCCITPVLNLDEAAQFWSKQFLSLEGHREPAPPSWFNVNEPRQSRPGVGQHTEEVLRDIGCTDEEIRAVADSLDAKL